MQASLHEPWGLYVLLCLVDDMQGADLAEEKALTIVSVDGGSSKGICEGTFKEGIGF